MYVKLELWSTYAEGGICKNECIFLEKEEEAENASSRKDPKTYEADYIGLHQPPGALFLKWCVISMVVSMKMASTYAENGNSNIIGC